MFRYSRPSDPPQPSIVLLRQLRTKSRCFISIGSPMATLWKESIMAVATGNTSDAAGLKVSNDVSGFIAEIWAATSGWHIAITVLLTLVAYDQCKLLLKKKSAVLGSRSNFCSVMYIKQKGSISGPTFKIPFMGPFLQSISPKFDGYVAQWARGKLSCVSVFHKYVYG
jgi:hypothetical protein